MTRARTAFVAIGLAGVVAVLGSQIVAEAKLTLDPPPADFASDRAAGPALGNAAPPATFSLPPPERFAAIAQRPLFYPSRRPPEEPVGVAPPVREPLQAILRGVVAAGGQRVAFLAVAGGSELVRVSGGDIVSGWKVDAISERDVRLSRGDETVLLQLHFRPGAEAGH